LLAFQRKKLGYCCKITEEITEDGKIDKSELEKICSEILQKLKIDQDLSFISNNYDPIEKIKTKLEYEEILLNKGDGIILKSGLFSLFEVQKQNIINDYENLINHIPKEIKVSENYEFQSFTSITTDPSQQFILNELKSKEKIIIQGPPGTGKSQTLTAILLNC